MEIKDISSLDHGFTLQGNPDECILMVHGFTGSSPEMYPLAYELNKQGYTVRSFCLPGHDERTLKALRKAGPKDWMHAVLDEYKKAKGEFKKVYLLGYSLGGALSVYSTKFQSVDALLLVEPCMRPTDKNQWLAPMIKWLPIKFQWEMSDLHYPENTERFLRGTTGFYVKSAADLLTVSKHARKQGKDVSCPLFVCFASKDTSVTKQDILNLLEDAPTNIKTFKIYEGNTHHLPLEPERRLLAEDIASFLKMLSANA